MRDSRSAGRLHSEGRGFTLVELLVVIGIIALLISILLPALNKAREQANIAKCSANMRSAMQAVHIYATEYKGWLPGPYTSGVIWKSSGAQIGNADVSNDETPTQNMDWVSPTFGKTFKWPENDYDRLIKTYNEQLKCPSNSATFDSIFPTGTSFAYRSGDLAYSSYAAIIQFHAYPSKDSSVVANLSNGLPPIVGDMYSPNNGGLAPPPGYAPLMNKVGPAGSKVFLVEGSRFLNISGSGLNMVGSAPSFNILRYQRQGGNFMIGGPYQSQAGTPFQFPTETVNSNFKYIPTVAKTFAFRHGGKMNVAFFDGHVELRAPADCVQVRLFVPKGTRIITAANTVDPKDSDNQVVD